MDRTGVDDAATAALQVKGGQRGQDARERQGLCDESLHKMGKGSPGSCHKGDTAVGSPEVQYETCG